MTDIIIDYMNSDFYHINNVGTAGQSLDIDTGAFSTVHNTVLNIFGSEIF